MSSATVQAGVGGEARWKFQGKFMEFPTLWDSPVCREGCNMYISFWLEHQHEISACLMPILCPSSSCLAIICTCRQNPLGSQPVFLAGWSVTQHPWVLSILYKHRSKLRLNLVLSFSHSSNILPSTEVQAHMSSLNGNKMPLQAPEAETLEVTVIVMNLCNK